MTDLARPAPGTAVSPRTLADATRHDILRRIAPALRHDLVVHLQSLGLVADALGARLSRGEMPAAEVQAAVARLQRLAREAVAGTVKASTWMEPAEDHAVSLREGVTECIDLLSASLGFRGCALRQQAGEGDMEVARGPLRYLLAAGLLALADRAASPGDLVVHAAATGSHAVITLDYLPQPGREVIAPPAPGQDPLAWEALEALAAEEGAGLQRQGEVLVLRLPRSSRRA